jgi:hypothetical protein
VSGGIEQDLFASQQDCCQETLLRCTFVQPDIFKRLIKNIDAGKIIELNKKLHKQLPVQVSDTTKMLLMQMLATKIH